MRIVMVGAGYVGLVTGTCLAEFGFSVTCVDADQGKVAALEAGRIPIYEPGLEEKVASNHRAGRLAFTTDLGRAMVGADVIFIAVGTPPDDDGHANLTHLFAAAEVVAKNLNGHMLVVVKSTVPVGTTRKVAALMRRLNPSAKFDIASNPEFLREGTAIEDFMQPDRIVAGVDSDHAKELMTRLYEPICRDGSPLFFTSPESAELIKYASNCFLATKIAFINEMSDLCEKVGASIRDVARGMGMDPRIGPQFLQPGPGFGGSCLPKDTQALAAMAHESGAPSALMEAVISSNDRRKRRMAEKIIEACGGKVAGKTVAILGLTFKPGTDDMRDSPSLAILPLLLDAGARLRAYDPQGMRHAREMIQGDIAWCGSVYEALEGVSAAAILTEWNEFRSLDFSRMKRLMKTPLIVDLRNLYKRREMQEAGFRYVSIGRGTVAPATVAESGRKPVTTAA